MNGDMEFADGYEMHAQRETFRQAQRAGLFNGAAAGGLGEIASNRPAPSQPAKTAPKGEVK